MADQLELQKMINALIEERNELMKQTADLMKMQVDTAAALKNALGGYTTGQKDSLSNNKELLEQLAEMGVEFDTVGTSGSTSIEKIVKKLQDAKTITEAWRYRQELLINQYPKLTHGAAGFIDGVSSGFKYLKEAMSSVIDLGFEVARGIKNIATEIIGIPFRSLDGLIAVSNKLVPLMEAVAHATEDVRKQFGSLAKDTAGRDILNVATNIGNEFKSLGLDGFRIFGSLDERIQSVNKTATAMGATFESFKNEMVADNGAVLFLQKGLGIADETMASIAKRAKATGTTFAKQFTEMAKYSKSFGKAFDVSAKLISRDVSEMIGDTKNFGNLGPKELSKVSVYARKLGLDVKDLLGVVEKFDTFESAAESTAMLSQAFGAQADAIKLMKAENPADRIEELRRAFIATGKSADQLNRQELKLLSQTTGLSEETAKVAFSQKNASTTMKQLSEQGKIAEKTQLSTAEAIEKVSDQIERLIKPFRQFKSFLDAFLDGFARNIFGAKDFRELLTNIHNALDLTYRTGMRVADSFTKLFPGFSGIIKTLKDAFKSGNAMTSFSAMLDNIAKSFEKFFNLLNGSATGPEAVGALFDNLSKSFNQFLDSFNGGAFMKSAADFSTGAGKIVAGMIDVIANGIQKALKLLTDFIKGDKTVNISDGGLVDSFLDPIKDELFGDGGTLSTLGKSFGDLFTTLWNKYGDKIKDGLKTIAVDMMEFLFTVGIVKAIESIAVASLSKVIIEKIVTSMTAKGAATRALASLASFGETVLGVIFSPVAIFAALAAASVGVADGMHKFNDKLSKEFDTTQAKVGSAVAGIVDVFTFGLVPDSMLESIGEFAAKGTKSLLDAIESIPFGKSIRENLESVVKSFIDVASSLGDLIMSFFKGDTQDVGKAAADFGVSVSVFFINAVKDGIPLAIEGLTDVALFALEKLGEIVLWTFVKLPIKILKYAAKAVEVVLGVFTGLFAGIASKFDDNSIIGSVFKFVAQILAVFTGMFAGISDWFDSGLDAWNLIFSDGLGSMLSDLIGRFGELYTNLKSSLTYAFNYENVKDLIVGFGKYIVEGLKEGLGSIGDAFKNAATSALDAFKLPWKIHSPSVAASEMGSNIVDGLTNSLKNLPGSMEDIADNGLKAVTSVFKEIPGHNIVKSIASPAVSILTNMIEEANAVTDALARLDPLTLDTRLKQLADRLGVGGESFKIKQGPINVVINLNVTMEADKLAKVLSEHGLVSTEKL